MPSRAPIVGAEHLGSHEVAKIVEAKVIESRALLGGDELLGEPSSASTA